MNKKEAELIVKSVLAGMASEYAVPDIGSSQPLREFGIDSRQAARLKKKLLLALSGTQEPESERFLANLKVTPATTVAAIAANLPRAYKESLPEGSAPEKYLKFKGLRKGEVEIAVRTALAQHSPKYSVFQINPRTELRDLGLNKEGVTKAKTTIYKTLVGPKSEVKITDFVRATPGKNLRTVNHLVDESIRYFSLPGEGTIRVRGGVGAGRALSLPGDSPTRQRGGIGGKRRR